MGITPETIEQYTKFMANKRLKEIGMQPLFEGFDSNPYKQLENIADTNGAGSVKGNFAMVGVFEKGKADVRFTARSAGGHSSIPGKNTPIPRLAAFVHSMEKKPPFRVKFEPEVKAMFGKLSRYASFPLRLVMGNLWLFGPVL